jgi:hypothetical protein
MIATKTVAAIAIAPPWETTARAMLTLLPQNRVSSSFYGRRLIIGIVFVHKQDPSSSAAADSFHKFERQSFFRSGWQPGQQFVGNI